VCSAHNALQRGQQEPHRERLPPPLPVGRRRRRPQCTVMFLSVWHSLQDLMQLAFM
jgi:hypothetical protein